MYRYNGKELDEATGLYDYGARWYDPAVARWGQVDPLADRYAPFSPYNYVLGNPISLIDPDGMRVDPSAILAKNNDGSYKDADLANAFIMFAQSNAGIAYLSQFAEAGQIIAGHEYKESGKLHAQGLDLSYSGWNGNYQESVMGANGVTRLVVDEKGWGEIQVFINRELNIGSNEAAENYKNNPSDATAQLEYQLNRMSTIFHESFIHGQSSALDYCDDCRWNNSHQNPSQSNKKGYDDHIAARKSNSYFNREAVPAIINIYSEKGSSKSREAIRKQLFNYSN